MLKWKVSHFLIVKFVSSPYDSSISYKKLSPLILYDTFKIYAYLENKISWILNELLQKITLV